MSGPPLTVTIDKTHAGLPVVVVTGALDIVGAPLLQEGLEVAERDQPERVVIDLRQCDFVDSTGLRTIVAAHGRARRRRRRLVIIKAPRSVQRIFRITMLERKLEFVNAPDEI